MFNILIMLVTFASSASIDDVIYSITSFLETGIVEEDSIFWNCATMGNLICG